VSEPYSAQISWPVSFFESELGLVVYSTDYNNELLSWFVSELYLSDKGISNAGANLQELGSILIS
jgi:hypothetical protein